jgi:endo-1,4-beta-xylanase
MKSDKHVPDPCGWGSDRLRRFSNALLIALLLAPSVSAAAGPEVVYLWPNGAPGSEGKSGEEIVRVTDEGERIVRNVHNPSLTLYLPSRQTTSGAAVVIAPGGGHREMWTDHEGHNIAKWLADHGIAGFMLQYRLAREEGSSYKIEQESLADTLRAIRLVRHRAAEWGVNPDRIGVMGFSAGGQLAALAAVRYAAGTASASDPVDRESSQPAFQALIYPAIPRDMVFTKQTPPAFLLCGENDRENISQGLAELYLQLKKAGVSAELHVYAGIGHGFGVRARNQGAIAGWPQRFHDWLGARGFLKQQ